MKKIFYITLAAFGFINTINAQTGIDRRDELTLGAKIGANYSNVYDSNSEDFVADGKLGLAVGAFVTVPLGTLFAIQPEVLFSQKGFKGSGTLLGTDYSYTHTTNYLDVPLFVAFRPTPLISVMAGPQFSYLLDTKYELNGNSTIDEEDINGDNYKKGVFGAVVGVDFNYQNFVLGTRLGWDVSKTNEDGDANSPRFKNKVIQVTFGYRF